MKKPFRPSRLKRDVDLDDILSASLNERKRRDTLTHVDSVMENIRDQLNGLQVGFCLVLFI